ncbi:MAG: PhoH family protein, partial [Acidimicrobiia bacterium]|nr:PhoH family protein [Acidimicrobiia bacterium]
MTSPVKIEVDDNQIMAGLLGQRDEYLRVVEDAFQVAIHARGNEILVEGADQVEAARVLDELVLVLQRGESLNAAVVRRSIDMLKDDERPSDVLTDRVLTTYRGKPVRPKTSGQKRYIDAVRRNIVTFGVGPAGTGKSWLAVACAVRALQDKQVERILLTRPAVEAG